MGAPPHIPSPLILVQIARRKKMSVLQGKGIWTLYDDIEQAVAKAPEVGAKFILCKVSKHGVFDANLAKKALAAVRVNPQLVPVAWNYVRMKAPALEAECIQRALGEGFAAFVLEAQVETVGKFKQANQFLNRVNQLGIDTRKVYLCGEPRLDNRLEKLPYLVLSRACRGGFLGNLNDDIPPPQRKHAAFNLTNQAQTEYKRHRLELLYTGPLMPVLSTTWDKAGKARMTQAEFKSWCLETQARNPTFISLYRAGLATSELWKLFRDLRVAQSETALLPDFVDNAVVVQPSGAGFEVEAIPPNSLESGWTTEFADKLGNLVRVRRTGALGTVIATYQPSLPKVGRYSTEVFIPRVHATTGAANYKIIHHPDGQRTEITVPVNQLKFSDVWVRLGAYKLNPQQPDSGRVILDDSASVDAQPKEIAFSAIRWRPLPEGGAGFDAPVGTESERASSQVWPGFWRDANPYLSKYELGYHTGADLNLNFPNFNMDKGQPVFAIANGVVVFADIIPGSWRGLIVIRHDPLPNGKPVYSRYGHVEDIVVAKGDGVARGQQIAKVGLFGDPAVQNYHLHFDISTTDLLETHPGNWPGENINAIRVHYVDPRQFIEDHRP